MPAGKSASKRKPTAKSPAKRTAPASAARSRPRSAELGGRVFAAARTLTLNRPEFEPLAAHYNLPQPSMLSPLLDFMVPSNGSPRPIEETTAGMASLPDSSARFVLSPLAVPDRIVDLRATVFNGAPSPCRLFSSRQYEGLFAGIRPGMEFDYELIAPFSVDDLALWARLQLQFSNGAELPMVQAEFGADELAFLLCLADAFKMSFARSFTVRRPEPAPTQITMADILEAQSLALSQPDRRWITHAMGELLSVVVHPGGVTGVGLPIVDETLAKREIRRYVGEGYMMTGRPGQNPSLELGPTLSVFAGSLFSWITLVSIHDMQVVGMEGGRPIAQEEILIFLATESTIWTIASEGLSRAGSDLSPVRFGLRSLDLISATELARDFFAPVGGLELPDEVYAPAGMRSVPTQPVSDGVAWIATHLIPQGGLRAWDTPDPAKAPITEVAAGLEVQVVEQQGAWARVVFSNGWSAWVDGRVLKEVGR